MKDYKQEVISNFERKIIKLRSQLINTLNSTARKHIQSSLAVLEVELATWRQS